MVIPSALQPTANTAAAIVLAAIAGLASIVDAPAAQPNRAAMVQHGAPLHRAAPAFHPFPTQYGAPHAGRTIHPAPAFTPPQNGNTFYENPNRIRPSVPLNNRALRPNLPLNNPGALRPNFPVNNPGGREPNPLANPDNERRRAEELQPLKEIQAGDRKPSTTQGTGSQSLMSEPVQPTVVRPLLKAPAGGFPQTRPAFPAVQVHDRFWPIHKGPRFMWLHGQRRLFTPVALLGVILIGDSYWYPDGYVSADGPACTGYTADGCQLQWRMVDLEDGGAEPQCVQYCPQAGPPPAEVATLPPPPPIEQSGACQTTIYSEPSFGGNSAPTGDTQPSLSETGWRNEIASIVVRAGTWDFFADENFGGESLRLGPGTYPRLAPEWTRHIGSFMCVEPGPPA